MQLIYVSLIFYRVYQKLDALEFKLSAIRFNFYKLGQILMLAMNDW